MSPSYRKRQTKNRHHAMQAVVTVFAIIALYQLISYIQTTRALNEQTRAYNQELINTYGGK